MKKIFAFFIIVALIVSLASCGNSETNSKTNGSTDTEAPSAVEVTDTTTTAEAAMSTEAAVETEESNEPEALTEASADAEPDDASLLENCKAQLVGTWTSSDLEEERLTFNEDGTGTYMGIFEKNFSFTYEVSVEHGAFANGEDFRYCLLHMNYDSGEAEEITFEFRDDPAERMVFRNGDNTGGYYGTLNFDEYSRVQ